MKSRKVDRYLVVYANGDCRVVKSMPRAVMIDSVVYRLSIKLPQRAAVAGTIELTIPTLDGEFEVTEVEEVAPPRKPQAIEGVLLCGEEGKP